TDIQVAWLGVSRRTITRSRRLKNWFFFFSSRRRHTRCLSDWSSDVCSSDLPEEAMQGLSETEKDMVRHLDWKALQDYGASFFCLEKLARTKGVSNPEMVAAFRGEGLEEFLKTRRVPGAR